MKKFLISGIAPEYSGVGRLMKNLCPVAHKKNYHILYPKYSQPVVELLKKGDFFSIIKKIFYKTLFILKLEIISKSEIILIHPQTIGYKKILNLIQFNTNVKMYLMDNSFFCMCSYNYASRTEKECLKCLNNPGSDYEECKPFPTKYNKSYNVSFLKNLQKTYAKIQFFVQTEHQKKLVQLHFGENVRVKNIGLNLNEIDFEEIETLSKLPKQDFIVYHGNLAAAKGILFVIKLAKHLKKYKLIIPFDEKTIRSSFPHIKNLSSNIILKKLTWESGLKEYVSSSKLILCPSIWSATIEGSLLKSLAYNGNVAVYNTSYGFENELPSNILLRLNNNLVQSASKINKFIQENQNNKKAATVWIKKFLSTNNSEKIFE